MKAKVTVLVKPHFYTFLTLYGLTVPGSLLKCTKRHCCCLILKSLSPPRWPGMRPVCRYWVSSYQIYLPGSLQWYPWRHYVLWNLLNNLRMQRIGIECKLYVDSKTTLCSYLIGTYKPHIPIQLMQCICC